MEHGAPPLCDVLAPLHHPTHTAERQQIQAELDALATEQPEAVRQGFAEPLVLGVASHHAGCLPAWKGLVERLFQRGGRQGGQYAQHLLT